MQDNTTKFSKIKFLELSFQGKIEHLWDYYKFHFGGALLLILLLIGGIFAWMEDAKPDILNGYLLNSNWGDDQASLLLQEYAGKKGYDLEEGNAYFNSSVYIDVQLKDQMSSVAYTKVMSDLDMKEIDFFFCNQEMFQYFGEKEAFLDLSEALPKDFLNQFDGRLLTTNSYDENGNITDTYIAGIDISESPVLLSMEQETKIYEDSPVILAIPYNTVRLERVMEFITFLYE